MAERERRAMGVADFAEWEEWAKGADGEGGGTRGRRSIRSQSTCIRCRCCDDEERRKVWRRVWQRATTKYHMSRFFNLFFIPHYQSRHHGSCTGMRSVLGRSLMSLVS